MDKSNPPHTHENHQEQEKIKIALDKISPPWSPADLDWLPSCTDNEFLDSPFDFAEFNAALNSRNTRSACGMDGIDYQTLQNLPIKYKLILLDIYNEIFQSNSYPPEWKKSYMHFIKKSDGKSVRPICLTSCLCKLFETLLKNKTQWWLEYNKLLPKHQTGFCKGHSTIDNLVSLTLNVEEAFSNKKDLLAAFLDVNGAFDNVNISILLEQLAKIGFPMNLIRFMKFLTYERLVYTELTGDKPRIIHKGVPQGGVLSPLLYSIICSEHLCKCTKKRNRISVRG